LHNARQHASVTQCAVGVSARVCESERECVCASVRVSLEDEERVDHFEPRRRVLLVGVEQRAH
jgi:hypothetical protein